MLRRTLIVITIALAVVFVPYFSMGQDCKSFKKDGWFIVYNKHYKKYAVMYVDSSLIGRGNEKNFLVKDGSGRYGIYGEEWTNCDCVSCGCGDKSKSLFSTPCDAKKYLLAYYREKVDDKWE